MKNSGLRWWQIAAYSFPDDGQFDRIVLMPQPVSNRQFAPMYNPAAMTDSKKPQAMPTGPERELQLYTQGLMGGKPSVPVPLDLLEAKAKEILTPRAYDYVTGGAGGEDTMRANREAFYRLRIVPRMLRDVAKRDLSVEVLGARLPAPVLLGPVGVQQIVHADSDLASARAAASLGLPFVLSTMSSRTIEEVSQTATKVAESPRWFQLYWGKNP